jgi:uncharacterized membrane protein
MAKAKKKSKYDTNPLDEGYAERADDMWGEPRPVEPLPKAEEPWPAEAPTKRYESSIPVSYPSVNVPPSYPPPVRQAADTTAPAGAVVAPPSSRAVPGLGLPENMTLILPYAPFFIGAVAGAVELFLTPRKESKVRFHAAQGLALQLVSLAVSLIFNFVSNVSGSNAGGKLFWAASTLFFIVAMTRIWKGEALHIGAADNLTDWLNERIEPQKKK